MNDKTPSQIENELAKSKGFECIPDPRRGGDFCRFSLAAWHVWSIVSHIPGRSQQQMAWQVARLRDDGSERYEKHYTRKHIPKGEHGIAAPGFFELKDALEYAIRCIKGERD